MWAVCRPLKRRGPLLHHLAVTHDHDAIGQRRHNAQICAAVTYIMRVSHYVVDQPELHESRSDSTFPALVSRGHCADGLGLQKHCAQSVIFLGAPRPAMARRQIGPSAATSLQLVRWAFWYLFMSPRSFDQLALPI